MPLLEGATRHANLAQRGPAGPICGSPARARALPSRLWFWRSTAPGAGYGRCWNRGPVAVVSAARGCAPSKPTDQPPLGASEYAVCNTVNL